MTPYLTDPKPKTQNSESRYLLGPSDSEVSSNATRHRFAALWNSTLLHVAAEAGDLETLHTNH